MGIEGRDYFRQSSRYTDRLTGWGWDAMPPVCKWIIILNVVVFLLQIFVTREPRREDFAAYFKQIKVLDPEATEEELPDLSFLPRVSIVQEWLQLETSKVLRGQVWRLLTCAFCHDRLGIWHLLINMLFFYWFGSTLEAMYGSREFLLFYLSAAMTASLAFVGLDLITSGAAPMIGASGAVMAVTMLFAIHYPRHVIYVMLIIPIEVRWLVCLYVIFDLHPVLLALAGDRQFTGVAHAAHLGGLAFGFLYWRRGWRLEPLLQRWRMPRLNRVIGSRRNVRLHTPSVAEEAADDVDLQLDAVLQKIHDHGEASLTAAEREVLLTASRRYQKRKR